MDATLKLRNAECRYSIDILRSHGLYRYYIDTFRHSIKQGKPRTLKKFAATKTVFRKQTVQKMKIA